MSEHAGERNVYTCDECSEQIITVNADSGTTPMALGCVATEGCPGGMFTAYYQVPPDLAGEPSTHEWFKPEGADFDRLSAGTKDHVNQGGLIIRRIAGEMAPPKTQPRTEKDRRCTTCRADFSEAEIVAALQSNSYTGGCPACGASGLPMDLAGDVEIKINWHELRILCIWAGNYAAANEKQMGDSPAALATIIRQLEAQFPMKTPLTLAGEMRQVADALGTKVTVTDASGQEIETFEGKKH